MFTDRRSVSSPMALKALRSAHQPGKKPNTRSFSGRSKTAVPSPSEQLDMADIAHERTLRDCMTAYVELRRAAHPDEFTNPKDWPTYICGPWEPKLTLRNVRPPVLKQLMCPQCGSTAPLLHTFTGRQDPGCTWVKCMKCNEVENSAGRATGDITKTPQVVDSYGPFAVYDRDKFEFRVWVTRLASEREAEIEAVKARGSRTPSGSKARGPVAESLGHAPRTPLRASHKASVSVARDDFFADHTPSRPSRRVSVSAARNEFFDDSDSEYSETTSDAFRGLMARSPGPLADASRNRKQTRKRTAGKQRAAPASRTPSPPPSPPPPTASSSSSHVQQRAVAKIPLSRTFAFNTREVKVSVELMNRTYRNFTVAITDNRVTWGVLKCTLAPFCVDDSVGLEVFDVVGNQWRRFGLGTHIGVPVSQESIIARVVHGRALSLEVIEIPSTTEDDIPSKVGDKRLAPKPLTFVTKPNKRGKHS